MLMTEWQERLWAFFLDDNGELSYCELCNGCDRDCKQSFRVIGIYCPYQARLKKEREAEKRKKVRR